MAKSVHNEKPGILISMYNVCKFFDLIDTYNCAF